jgi:hypothetical protein
MSENYVRCAFHYAQDAVSLVLQLTSGAGSGTSTARGKLEQEGASEGDKKVAKEWSMRIERGLESNSYYLREKWACHNTFSPRTCDFKRPFGQRKHNISFWELDTKRRQCIDGITPITKHEICPFSLVIT